MSTNISLLSCSSFAAPGAFLACGLPGLSLLAARLNDESSPPINFTRLFITDVTSDEELRPANNSEECQFYDWDDASMEQSTNLTVRMEKEIEAEEMNHRRYADRETKRHSRALDHILQNYDLRQQRALLLQQILPRVSASLETLVYLPYRTVDDDDFECGYDFNSTRTVTVTCIPPKTDPRDVILYGSLPFPKLTRLTLRLGSPCSVPFDKWSPDRFSALTHLHLISQGPLPSIHNLPVALTHLRLTGSDSLKFEFSTDWDRSPMELPISSSPIRMYYGGASRKSVPPSIPSNIITLLQPRDSKNDSAGYCSKLARIRPFGLMGDDDVSSYDELMRELKAVADTNPNIHIFGQGKSEEDLPAFPMSKALEEGGWIKESNKVVEWDWDSRDNK